MEEKKLELVSPAGGWDHLKAALLGGADAVYLGYKKFGARAYAENFDINMLKKAAVLAHNMHSKVYLTLNTLIKNSEIREVADFLNQYWQICQDGIIIQDLGLYKLIKDLFPQLRLHASTQLNIHNLESIKFMEEMDINRVVLAREMTMEEIKSITQNSNTEIEIFGHGSQCYSYSGQCYFSSFVGGRSGNRGRCPQPCRMKYRLLYREEDKFHYEDKKFRYYLSKKDLNTIKILPDIIKSGADALKIEGRMKSPEYVGIVTKIYRKYIDKYYKDPNNYKVEDKDLYKLEQIFLRDSGTGYFKKEYPKDIISPKTSGSIGNFAGRIYRIDYSRRKKVKAIYIKSKLPLNEGDLLEIWTNQGNERITVGEYEELGTKGSKTLYKLRIKNNIRIQDNDRVFKYFDKKLDGEAKSLYLYQNHRIKTEIDNNQNLKDYEINFYLEKHLDSKPGGSKKSIKISANVYDDNLIKPLADLEVENIIYCGACEDKLAELRKYCSNQGSRLFLDIPNIIYDRQFDKSKKEIKELAGKGFDKFQVSNLGALNYLVKETGGVELILGHNFNIFNSLAAEYISSLIKGNSSLAEAGLSPELNLGEAGNLINSCNGYLKEGVPFSIFGYGNIPVINARYKLEMLNNNFSQGKEYYLEDIKGYKFKIDSDINNNIVVYNSRKICALFDIDKLTDVPVEYIRLDLKDLNLKEAKKVINSYRKAISIARSKGKDLYREYVNCLKDDILFKNYTRGHLLRGVK